MKLITISKTPPKLIASRILSVIGPITCVIGGALVISAGIEKIPLNIASGFASLGEIVLGLFIIIVALISFKYHTGGAFICFAIGIFSLTISFLTSFYYLSLLGPLLLLIGSFIGIIGVFLTSPKQIKNFGICIIIIAITYFLFWLFSVIMASQIVPVSPT